MTERHEPPIDRASTRADAPEPRRTPWLTSDPFSLQIQSVLFGSRPQDVLRSLESIERAVQIVRSSGQCEAVTVRYGDSSPEPCLAEANLAAWRERFAATFALDYDFFDGNLGSAGGQNRLAAAARATFLVIQNPDIVPSPRAYQRMLEPFRRAQTGIVEARQLPLEHPKTYEPETGLTLWASMACSMMPLAVFRQVGTFDADTFFLYCDDVDISWRAREAGHHVVFQPSACVFHDKRLSDEGAWQPTAAERYYSAEAALLLAYKWSRPDIVGPICDAFERFGDEFQKKALRAFRERQAQNRLPVQRDPDHRIGYFKNGVYAEHRYAL